MLDHEREHLGAALQVRVDLLGRDDVADDGMQVFGGGSGVVLDPVAPEDLVVRDPDAAARACCGAAVVWSLLDDHRRQALVGGGERGDHASGTATDHDDVILLSAHIEHVIELAAWPTTAPVEGTTRVRSRGLENVRAAGRRRLASPAAQRRHPAAGSIGLPMRRSSRGRRACHRAACHVCVAGRDDGPHSGGIDCAVSLSQGTAGTRPVEPGGSAPRLPPVARSVRDAFLRRGARPGPPGTAVSRRRVVSGTRGCASRGTLGRRRCRSPGN